MQQENYRRVWWTGFPVKNAHAIGFDAMDGGVRHVPRIFFDHNARIRSS
jgi:hypothetical protein